jgi:hypothetical protein
MWCCVVHWLRLLRLEPRVPTAFVLARLLAALLSAALLPGPVLHGLPGILLPASALLSMCDH